MLRKAGVRGGQRGFRSGQRQWLFQYLGHMLVWRPSGVRESASGLTTQASQAELVQLANLVWVLNMILNDVDVVGAGQESGESRRLGIP